MKNNQTSQMTRQQRFDQYVALLAEAVDHPDRAEPLRDYCTGLLLPVKRKSIEPIEPPRDSRRLQFLRGWSHENNNEVFAGVP